MMKRLRRKCRVDEFREFGFCANYINGASSNGERAELALRRANDGMPGDDVILGCSPMQVIVRCHVPPAEQSAGLKATEKRPAARRGATGYGANRLTDFRCGVFAGRETRCYLRNFPVQDLIYTTHGTKRKNTPGTDLQ